MPSTVPRDKCNVQQVLLPNITVPWTGPKKASEEIRTRTVGSKKSSKESYFWLVNNVLQDT